MSKKYMKPIDIDVIIISWSKNKELLQETKDCLQTLFDSEDCSVIRFNTIVVETDTETSFDLFETKGHSIKTIHPKVSHPDLEFGYHTYLNLGLEQGNAEWTCLCNNDLDFKKNWALKILQVIFSQRNIDEKQWEYVSACPANPKEQWHKEKLDKIELGYGVRQHVAGWCLFQSRNVFEKFGKLEERIKFWFCDNWYSVACQWYKIPHIFVGTSIVEHHSGLEGTTTIQSQMEKDKKHKLTYGAGDEFRKIARELMNDETWGVLDKKQQKEFEEKSGNKYY